MKEILHAIFGFGEKVQRYAEDYQNVIMKYNHMKEAIFSIRIIFLEYLKRTIFL